jgi:hypothetical protein
LEIFLHDDPVMVQTDVEGDEANGVGGLEKVTPSAKRAFFPCCFLLQEA